MTRLFSKKYIPWAVSFLTIVSISHPANALLTRTQQDVYTHCANSVVSGLTIRAEDGDPNALFEHGLLLFYGHCVEENRSAGLLRLKSAASKGHIEAAFSLGDIYADKSLHGLHDPNKAYHYLLYAAKNDHLSAKHILGIILVRGDIGKDQQHRGLYWLGVAASEGHGLSAIIMGHLHEHGKYGIKQDPCLARDWYELCLNLGVQEAINFIHTIDAEHNCN